jgi:hypothetical protein
MNISTYLSLVNNSIENVKTLRPDGVLISTYENIGKYGNIGGSLYLNYNPFKWVKIWVQGSGGYSQYQNEGQEYGAYSLNCYGGLNFTLPWKLKLNFGGGGSTPWTGYKYEGSAWYYYYGSISRSFLKGDKLTVSLSAQNPFEKYRTFTNKSWEDEIFTRNSRSKQLSRNFGLSVSWRFGEMKAQIKKAERGISNDDVKSGGEGNSGGN